MPPCIAGCSSCRRPSSAERIFPYDLVPRIITADEWETIERGLVQRLTALNLFLKDIYCEGGRILGDGVVPSRLVYSAQHYRPEMQGIRPRRDVYVSVAGSDLVRLPDGGFAVLGRVCARTSRTS